MTLKDDFAAKGRVMFAYGADGRVCATQRRISKSAVPLYCALMNLNSPNLPKVISVREDEDGATVTEGYIDGVNLRKALHDGTLGEEELRRLAIDICSALSLLHGSCPPVIHRDIKPENIIRTDGGRYVLIDFDASRLFKPGATSDTVTLGTHGYAAPEQYGFGQTGPESDIYSLGATLYEAAEGKPYAPGAEISCPMGRIIKKCLEFSARDRYSSADELLEELGVIPPLCVPCPSCLRCCWAFAPALPLAAGYIQKRKHRRMMRRRLQERPLRLLKLLRLLRRYPALASSSRARTTRGWRDILYSATPALSFCQRA